MFNIMIKEIREFVREKTNLFFFILFPVILVFLLGNLLQSTDLAEGAIGSIKLQYLIETEDLYQLQRINSFIEVIEDDENISFDQAKDLETAKRLAGEDTITAVIIFTGNPIRIQVYEGIDRIKNRTVEAILNSFTQTNKTITAVMETSPQALTKFSMEEVDYAVQKDLGVERTMIDYYAVAMVVMIAFMSMLVGANAFMSERQNKTINRLIIVPQSRVSMFLQKVIGIAPQALLQVAIIMVFSVLVFKAHYAATLVNNLYLFFMFFMITFSSVSIGAVIGMLIKLNPFIVIMPVLWIMLFFGGSFSKAINVQGITNRMPSYIFQQAAFDLAIFGRFDKANAVVVTCGIITIAALAIGAFIFSRKEEER